MSVRGVAISWMLVIVALFGCDTESNTPRPVHYLKLYGGDGNQVGADLVEGHGNSYLLLGTSHLGNERRIYLVNIDQQGNVLWERTMGGFADEAVDIEETEDGNFVILSRIFVSANNADFKLTRVTPDGAPIDSVTFGFAAMDDPKSVTALDDGGFIVVGRTMAGEADENSADPAALTNHFHIRFLADLSVDPSFRQVYGDPGHHDVAIKIFADNAYYYVFGHSDQPHDQVAKPAINMQYYGIDRLTENIETSPRYLGVPEEEVRAGAVCQVPAALGGGFAILGTKTLAAGNTSLHFAKLNSPLQFLPSDEQLDTAVPINNRQLEAVAVCPALVGVPGYVLLANETRSAGTRNIFVTKVDQSGTVIWSATFGSEQEDDHGAAVMELGNGKIFVLGTVEVGDNQTKIALLLLSETGRLHD